MKEKALLKKIAVVVLIILLIFLVYFIYIKKEEKVPIIEKPKDIINTIDLTQSFDAAGTYDYYIETTKGKKKIQYTFSDEDPAEYSFILNNKTIISGKGCNGAAAVIDVIDDIIIVSYHIGCDIDGYHLTAFDIQGNKIFDYEFLDNDNPSLSYNGEFSIVDKSIMLSAESITNGPSVYYGTVENPRLNKIKICDKKAIKKADLGNDYIAIGKYKITYTGNNNFSKPELVDKTTLTNYILMYDCDK